MSTPNEQRSTSIKGTRRRWASLIPLRRSVPSSGVQTSGNLQADATTPSSTASGMLESASNVGIYGGSMISAGGNITIINDRHLNDNAQLSGDHIHGRYVETDPFQEQPSEPLRTQDSDQRSCNIYYRSLIGKRRGSPLWIPEPSYNLPLEYQRAGVSIGDVGILLASGSFNYFFNIFYRGDHPVNQGNVPEDFLPLVPPLTNVDIQTIREFNAGSYVTSESIQISHRQYSNSPITDLLFESTAEEGAILTLPHGAYSQDVINTLRLRSYIARHVESWYKYVIGVRGCEVKNGDIRLVIGCDKTDLWGMAAFVKSSETVRLKYQPIRQGETYKWEYSGAFDTRTGPDPQTISRLRLDDAQTIYNQCVFARTLNANLREDIWKRIVGDIYAEIGLDPDEVFKEDSHYSAAVLHSGSTTTSSSRGSAASSTQTPNVSMRMMPHPSNLVNNLLWNHVSSSQEIKTIITTDSDWISVIQEDDQTLPRPEVLYERIMSRNPFLIADIGNNYVCLDFPSSGPSSSTAVIQTDSRMDVEDKDNQSRECEEEDEKKGSMLSTSERVVEDIALVQPDAFVHSRPNLSSDSVEDTEGTHTAFRDASPTYNPMRPGYEQTYSTLRRIHSSGGPISRTSSRQSLIDRTNIPVDSSSITGNEPLYNHPESLSREGQVLATLESRRQIIEKEQRRRQELTDGYARLKEVLPFTSMKISKVSLIERAANQIKILEEENRMLRAKLMQVEKEYQSQLHSAS